MRGPALGNNEPEEDSAGFGTFIALQPVMDLQDRTVFGYEALPRASMREDTRKFVRGALPAVQYTSPAVLFVPLTADVLQDEEFDPFSTADDVGAAPGEVAWVIAEATALELVELVERRVAKLRERGFLIALAEVAPGVLGRRPVGDLMPSFVMLDPTYTDYVSTGIRARARARRASCLLRPAQCARHSPRHRR